MRKYLLAAVAAAALATPATARDKSLYVGVEGGLMLVEDTGLRYEYDGEGAYDINDAIDIDHKYGFDIDLVGGYDFGLIRTELELAYKRASIDEVMVDSDFAGPGIAVTEPFDADGSVRVWSVMLNALLDFGDEDNWSGVFGLGAGIADVKYDVEIPITPQIEFDAQDSDTGFAWQIIAGVRKAITPQLDLGLKYRMFTSSHRDFEISSNESFDGRFRSHSLLLSLIYNLAPPPPPPPPPPPAPPPPPPPPATQTCPDGTVILATDACPPPPPPPPPPPEPERG